MPPNARLGVRVASALSAVGLAVPALVVTNSAPASAVTITDHAVINEIFANPITGNEWIEVYDPTTGTFGAAVCEITDNDGNSTDPGCGNMTGDFLLRWPDSPFLDDDGDTVTLVGHIDILDTVSYPALDPGESYARSHDGSTEWEIRSGSEVTPNASNGEPPTDNTPPTLHVAAPTDGGSYPGGFTVNFSASDVGTSVGRVDFYLRDGTSTGPYLYESQDINSAGLEPYNSFELFYPLAPGTYDLCVAAVDQNGNGIDGSPNLETCDDGDSSVVAVDDIVVTEGTTPTPDPVVMLSSPVDGAIIADGTPTLNWERTIDPGFLLINQELTLSTSADFTQVPVTFTPSGTTFTLPESFDGGDATWYWKVVLTYARSSTAPDEVVVSDAWQFTVDRDPAEPTEPRFEVNGVDFDTYRYPSPDSTDVHPLPVCTLSFETFGIGSETAMIDVASEGSDGTVPLIEGRPITFNHDPVGSNGTWQFDLADYAGAVLAGPDGYVLQVAISTDDSDLVGTTRFSLPLDCMATGDGNSDDADGGDTDDGDADDGGGIGDGDDGSEIGEGGAGSGGDTDDGASTDSGADGELPLTGLAGGVAEWWWIIAPLLLLGGAGMLVRRRLSRHAGA